MQKYCTELTEKLLLSVDQDYNVTNMGGVLEVIAALEKTTITKEALEITRLGKHINELRRRTSIDALAKRAKDLVRRWRELVLPASQSTPQPTVADTAPPALNGANTQNLALRNLKPQSPAFKGLKPQSPLLKTTTLSRVSSPSLSLHSDQSRSPVISPIKPPVAAPSNHKFNSNSAQLEVKSGSQNHVQEAVPRTYSSNKRLRKEDPIVIDLEPPNKKHRLNGESVSGNNINSQVPSPTLKERNPELIEPSSNDESVVVVKKRGRKKGSKSIKKQVSVEDTVKEKLASFSRNPKLKTTQELLADLQARGTNSNANLLPSQSVNPPNIEDVLRTKNDGEVSKYLSNNQNNFSHRKVSDAQRKSIKKEDNFHKSQHRYAESDTLDEDTRDSIASQKPLKSSQDLTVEEILAKLPPLDPESIDWSEDDTYVDNGNDDESKSNIVREVTKEDIDRLHTECVEGLNGNFQPKSCSASDNSESKKTCDDEVNLDSVTGLRRPSDSHKDEVFREWHEMLARPSCDGQILHILPYVIID